MARTQLEIIFFLRVFCMSENPDKTIALEGLVSTAEYIISSYLKDHNECLKEELFLHVISKIAAKENREGYMIIDQKPIHTLAWLIAFKELEMEGVITVDRKDLAFPLIDNRSRFSLKT